MKRSISLVFLSILLGAPLLAAAESPVVDPAQPLPHRFSPQPQVEDRRFPLLPFQGKGELFDIPPGFERPIEVDEGDLIPVRSFVLSGIDSVPELAPFAPRLLEVLDAERIKAEERNLQSDRRQGDDGFGDFGDDDYGDEDGLETEGEFADGSPDQTTPDADGADPAAPSADRIRGMTIGQIQQAANVAAASLREEGYFLVQAVIPEQTVVDGEVNVLFLPGNLGKVRVENNRWFGDEQISDLYKDMIGKPVNRRQLERGILGTQALPGLKSYATLVRGGAVGETDLLVRTQAEDRHDFALAVNNSNLRATGAWVTQFDYTLNNPLGAADALSLSLRTSIPSQNRYYALSYDLPLSHTTSLFFNLYNVDYEIESTDTIGAITGSTLNFTTRFQWQMLRSRYFNLYLTNIIDWRALETIAGDGLISRSSKLSSYSLSFSGDWVETRGNSLNTFELAYTLGLPGFIGADEPLPEGDPLLQERLDGDAEYSLFYLSYQRLQSMNTNNSLLFKFSYSRSGDQLYSIHNSSVGGPENFRALPSSSLLRENVFLATVEYILSPFSSRRFNDALTWGQVIQFSLFVDYAVAERSDRDLAFSTPEEPDAARLAGAGFSAQFIVPDLVKFRLDYGYLFLNKATPGQSLSGAAGIIDSYVYGDSLEEQSSSQIYLELAYYF